MKSTSQIGMVFFCAGSRIAVWSVFHRLGSFCRNGIFQTEAERASWILPFLACRYRSRGRFSVFGMEMNIKHGLHNTADPGTAEVPGLQGGVKNPQNEVPFLVLFLKKYSATPPQWLQVVTDVYPPPQALR